MEFAKRQIVSVNRILLIFAKNMVVYGSVPFLFVTVHWFATYFYTRYCVISSLWGYLDSFIRMASPICSFTVVVMERTSEYYLKSMVTITMGVMASLQSLMDIRRSSTPPSPHKN